MRVELGNAYDSVHSLIDDERKFVSLRGTEEFATLERDLIELKAKALDHSGRTWVPAPTTDTSSRDGRPSLSKIDCSTLTTSTQIVVAIRGQNLINPGIAFIGKVASSNVVAISTQLCLAAFPPTLRSSSDLTNAQVRLYCESGLATTATKLDIPLPADYNDGVLPIPTPSPPPGAKN